ncbi:hypothetical protein V8E36_003413 [Tilletia maclaganii]
MRISLLATLIAVISTTTIHVTGLPSDPSNDQRRIADVNATAVPAPVPARAKPKPTFGAEDYPTVRGSNLGGWLLLEPWITPDLMLTPDLKALNKYIPDEWTYTQVLGRQEAAARLQVHYATFVTEDDFRMMRMHGLNLVRIPVPYYAFNTSEAEPYVGQIQLPYLGRAIKWADQYGLDVILDLHALPNSQNGFDNSGHAGGIHFADEATFVDDSARAMSALIDMVELFVNDPQFNGAVAAIEVINEPLVNEQSKDKPRTDRIPLAKLEDWYRAAYSIVQAAVSPTALRRPVVLMHDAFMPPGTFDDTFNDDRGTFKPGTYALDTHIYQAFNGLNFLSEETHLYVACGAGGNLRAAAGPGKKGGARRPVLVGEFSIGTSTRCVPYVQCEGRSIADDIRTLTDYNPRPTIVVEQQQPIKGDGSAARREAKQQQQQQQTPQTNASANADANVTTTMRLNPHASFARRFFEAQTAVFEANSMGYVYWNWKTQAAAAWSLRDIFLQGWAPSRLDDPSMRMFKYDAKAAPCISENVA